MQLCSAAAAERLRRATKLLLAASVDMTVAAMPDVGCMPRSDAREADEINAEIARLADRIDTLHASLTTSQDRRFVDLSFGGHPRRRTFATP